MREKEERLRCSNLVEVTREDGLRRRYFVHRETKNNSAPVLGIAPPAVTALASSDNHYEPTRCEIRVLLLLLYRCSSLSFGWMCAQLGAAANLIFHSPRITPPEKAQMKRYMQLPQKHLRRVRGTFIAQQAGWSRRIRGKTDPVDPVSSSSSRMTNTTEST